MYRSAKILSMSEKLLIYSDIVLKNRNSEKQKIESFSDVKNGTERSDCRFPDCFINYLQTML